MTLEVAFPSTIRTAAITANSSGNASLSAPTNVTTIMSGGPQGTLLIEVLQLATGLVNLGVGGATLYYYWLFDGTNYHLIDSQFAGNSPIGGIGTDPIQQEVTHYEDLIIPNGWSLVQGAGSIPVSGHNPNTIVAFGGDL